MGERGWVDEMLERACGVSGLRRGFDGVDGVKVVGVWREVEGIKRTMSTTPPFIRRKRFYRDKLPLERCR